MKKSMIIEGIKIFYTDTGSGTPVLCIHGNPGCAEDFSTQAMDSFRVIAIDRPGHGSSQRYTQKSDHLAHQIRLINAFAKALNLENVILAAHSWGCFIALSYALTYPETVKAMLLFAPIAFPRTDAKSPTSGLVKTMQLPVLGPLVSKLLSSTAGKSAITTAMANGFSPDPMPEQYAKAILPGFLTAAAFRHVCEDKADFEFNIMEKSRQYQNIGVNTLLVCGEMDAVTDNATQGERLQKTMKNARLVTIAGMGHQIPQLNPGLIKEKLQEL